MEHIVQPHILKSDGTSEICLSWDDGKDFLKLGGKQEMGELIWHGNFYIVYYAYIFSLSR